MSSVPVQVFTLSVCQLVSEVAHTVEYVFPIRQDVCPKNLLTEWEEFFSEGIFSSLLPLFHRLHVTGEICCAFICYTIQLCNQLMLKRILCFISYIKLILFYICFAGSLIFIVFFKISFGIKIHVL